MAQGVTLAEPAVNEFELDGWKFVEITIPGHSPVEDYDFVSKVPAGYVLVSMTFEGTDEVWLFGPPG